MSKGYPTAKTPPEPDIGELVPPGVCPICKRRPVAAGKRLCADCDARLHAP